MASIFIIALATDGDKFPALGEGIGLIEVKGVILDSEETVKQLGELKKNDRVKAVVLRIDSPGGVVGPSQEIYAEVKKLGAKKKVVVSMEALQHREDIILRRRLP